jgi:5-carboxymethyl-2-hydroxymuconate isomerase
MPHIYIEYSKDIEDMIQIPALMTELHTRLAAQDGVDIERIKTKSFAMQHSLFGTHAIDARAGVHITLLILEGRDRETRKSYGQSLFEGAKAMLDKTGMPYTISLEVRDMDRDTYFV